MTRHWFELKFIYPSEMGAMQRLTLTLHIASVLVQESRSITKKAIPPLQRQKWKQLKIGHQQETSSCHSLSDSKIHRKVWGAARDPTPPIAIFLGKGGGSLSSQTTVRLYLSLQEGGELQSYLPSYICWQPKCLWCPWKAPVKSTATYILPNLRWVQ